MELCEEQEKKENYTWAYTFHLTPNTNHRCPDAHMQTDSQTYCRLFIFFFFFFATPTTSLHSAHSNSAHHPHTLFRLVHSFCLMVCILEVLIGCRISRQRWLAICIVFFPPLKSSCAEPLTITDALYGHTHNNCFNQSDWTVIGCSPKRISPSRCFRGSNERWGKRGGTGVNVAPVSQQISCCIQPRVPPDSDFILIPWLTRGRNPDCTH